MYNTLYYDIVLVNFGETLIHFEKCYIRMHYNKTALDFHEVLRNLLLLRKYRKAIINSMRTLELLSACSPSLIATDDNFP